MKGDSEGGGTGGDSAEKGGRKSDDQKQLEVALQELRYLILKLLSDEKELYIRQLARRLKVSEAAVSFHLETLETNGLVTSRYDQGQVKAGPSGARVIKLVRRYTLTDRGIEVLEAAKNAMEDLKGVG
jgi:DNA-binding transcriptional ArsR family regulator